MVKRRNTLLVTKRSLRNADVGSDKRPRRTVTPKVVDDTVGLSRREEQDLNKALYASLQDTRRSKSLPSLSNPCVNAAWRESPGASSSKIDRVNLSRKRRLRGNTISPKRGLRRSSSAVQSSLSGISGRAASLGASRSHTNVSVDESSQDSVKSSSSSANGSKKKIHAQRKFAQGCSLPGTPTSGTPVKATSTPIKLLSRIPKTEDFLTFLCLRGTSVLPPHLDFFNFSREEIPHREEGSRSMGSSGKLKRRRESTPETSSSSSSGANEEIAEAGVSTPSSSKGSNLGQVKQSAARASAGTPDTARGIVSLRQGLQRKVSSSASSSSQSSSPCVCSSPSHLLSAAGQARYPVKYRNKFYFTPEQSPSPSKASGILPGEFTPPRPTCAGFRYMDKSSPSVCQPTSSKLSPLAYPSSPQCLPRRSSSSSSSLSSSASGVGRRKLWCSLFSSAGGNQVNPEPSVSGEIRGVKRSCTVIDAPSSLILSASSSPQSSPTSFPSHGAAAAFSSASSTLCLSSFSSFPCSQATSQPSCRVVHGLHCLKDLSCCPRHRNACPPDKFIPTTSSACSPCSYSLPGSTLSCMALNKNEASLEPCNVVSASMHVDSCERRHSSCSHASPSNPTNAYCSNQTQRVPKHVCSSAATSVHDFLCSNQHDQCFCTQNPFCENVMNGQQCCPDEEACLSETELFVSSENAVVQDDDALACDVFYVENDIHDDAYSRNSGCVSTADGCGCSEDKLWVKGLAIERDNKKYENISVIAEVKTADGDEKEGLSVEEVEAMDEEEKCPVEYMSLLRKKKKKKKKNNGMSMRKKWKKEMRRRKLGVSKKYSLVQEVPKLRIRIVKKNSHSTGAPEKNLSVGVEKPSPADFQQEFVKMLQSGQFCTVLTDEPQENVSTGKESYNYNHIPTDSQFKEMQACSKSISEDFEEKVCSEFLKNDNEVYDTTFNPHSSPELHEEEMTSEVVSVDSVQGSEGFASGKQGGNMKSVPSSAEEGKSKNSESCADLKSQNSRNNLDQPSKLSDSIILRDKVISAFAKFNQRETIVGNVQAERESKKREDELSRCFLKEQHSLGKGCEKDMCSETGGSKDKTFSCRCLEEKIVLPMISMDCERKDVVGIDKDASRHSTDSKEFSMGSDQNALKSAPTVSNQIREERLCVRHCQWGENGFCTSSVTKGTSTNTTVLDVPKKFIQSGCSCCMLKNEEMNENEKNGGLRHSPTLTENSVILSSHAFQTLSDRGKPLLESHSHKENEKALKMSCKNDILEEKEKDTSIKARVSTERERSDAATQVYCMDGEMCLSLASGDESLSSLLTNKATQTCNLVKENSLVEKAVKGKTLNQQTKGMSQNPQEELDFDIAKVEKTLMDTSSQNFTGKEILLEAHKRRHSDVNKEQQTQKQMREIPFGCDRIRSPKTLNCCVENTSAKFPQGDTETNVDPQVVLKKKNTRHAWEVFADGEKSVAFEERGTISSKTSFYQQSAKTLTVSQSSGLFDSSSCGYHTKDGVNSSSNANEIMIMSETKATQSHPQPVVSNCLCYYTSTPDSNEICKGSSEKSFAAKSLHQHSEISQTGAVKYEKLLDSSSQTDSSELVDGHVEQAGSEADKFVSQHTAPCLQSAGPVGQVSNSLQFQSPTSKRSKLDSSVSFLKKDLNANMASFCKKDVPSNATHSQQSVEKKLNSSTLITGSGGGTVQTNENTVHLLHLRDVSDIKSDISDEIILLDDHSVENNVFLRGSCDKTDQGDSHVYSSDVDGELMTDLSLPGSDSSSSDSCSSMSSVGSSDNNTNSCDSLDSLGVNQLPKKRSTLDAAVLMKHPKSSTHIVGTLDDRSLQQIFMSKDSAIILDQDSVNGQSRSRDCPRIHKEVKGFEGSFSAHAAHHHGSECKRKQEPQTLGNGLPETKERRHSVSSKPQPTSVVRRHHETIRNDSGQVGNHLCSIFLNKQSPSDIILHSYGSLNTGQGYALINGSLQKCEILNKRECPRKENNSYSAEDDEENLHANPRAGIVSHKKSELRIQKEEECDSGEKKYCNDNTQDQTRVPEENNMTKSSEVCGTSNSKSLDGRKETCFQPYPSAQLRIGQSIYLKDRELQNINQKCDTEPSEKQRAKTHRKSNQAQVPSHSVWGDNSTFQMIKKDQEVRPGNTSQLKVQPALSQKSTSDVSALVTSVPYVGGEQRADFFPASLANGTPSNSPDSFTKDVSQSSSMTGANAPSQVNKSAKAKRSKNKKNSKREHGRRDLKLDEIMPWPYRGPEQGKNKIKKRMQQYRQEQNDDSSFAYNSGLVSQNAYMPRKSLSDWLATETANNHGVHMHPGQVFFNNHGVLETESAPLRHPGKILTQSSGSVCDISICKQPNRFSVSDSNATWNADKKNRDTNDFRYPQADCITSENMSKEISQISCTKDVLFTSNNCVIPVELPASCVSQSNITSHSINLQNVVNMRSQDTLSCTYSQNMNVQKTEGINNQLTYSWCPVPDTPTSLMSAQTGAVKSLSGQSVFELPSSIQTTPSFSHSLIQDAPKSGTLRTESEIVGNCFTSSLSQSPLETRVCPTGDGNVLDAVVEELKVQIAILKDEISQGTDLSALERAPPDHTKVTGDKFHAQVGRGTSGLPASSTCSWDEQQVENTWTASTSTNKVSTPRPLMSSSQKDTSSKLQCSVPSVNEVASADKELLLQGASGEWYEVQGTDDHSASRRFYNSSSLKISEKPSCNIFLDDGGDYIEISDSEDD